MIVRLAERGGFNPVGQAKCLKFLGIGQFTTRVLAGGALRNNCREYGNGRVLHCPLGQNVDGPRIHLSRWHSACANPIACRNPSFRILRSIRTGTSDVCQPSGLWRFRMRKRSQRVRGLLGGCRRRRLYQYFNAFDARRSISLDWEVFDRSST